MRGGNDTEVAFGYDFHEDRVLELPQPLNAWEHAVFRRILSDRFEGRDAVAAQLHSDPHRMPVTILVHVRSGYLIELGAYRAGGTSFITLPDIDRLHRLCQRLGTA